MPPLTEFHTRSTLKSDKTLPAPSIPSPVTLCALTTVAGGVFAVHGDIVQIDLGDVYSTLNTVPLDADLTGDGNDDVSNWVLSRSSQPGSTSSVYGYFRKSYRIQLENGANKDIAGGSYFFLKRPGVSQTVRYGLGFPLVGTSASNVNWSPENTGGTTPQSIDAFLPVRFTDARINGAMVDRGQLKICDSRLSPHDISH